MKNQEQQKKKKRKILLSLIIVLFVGIILTASTYTWFTANRTVTVEALDVNVSTTAGLLISTDAINWKTIVTKDDIQNASGTYPTATNQLPADTTEPVSTAGVVDTSTGFINMYKGTLAANETGAFKNLTATKSTETNGTTGDFIAFDLFFQTNQDTDLYLTSNSNVIAGATDSNIQNATRVAFLPQGHSADTSASATNQTMHATDTTGLKIWEPNADQHTTGGVANAANYPFVGSITAGTGNATLKYYGINNAIATAQDIASTDSGYFTDMDTTGFIVDTPASGIPSTGYQQILHIERGVTKVRIYMWVEGQDVDCENNASGGDLLYNLQFSSLASANA